MLPYIQLKMDFFIWSNKGWIVRSLKNIKENYLDSLKESDYYKNLNETIYKVVVMLLAFAIFIGCMAGLVTTLGNLGMLITIIVLSVYVGFALKIYESLYYKDKK